MPKFIQILKEIVGGWLSLMSGAISIPFTFLALFSDGTHSKWWFAILAIATLWIFAIRVVWVNYQFVSAKRDKALFAAMIELIRNDQYNKLKFDPIGTIIHYANDIENEDCLNWYCDQFVMNGYSHPLQNPNNQSENLIAGKWLPVLQMARNQAKVIKCENNLFTYLSGDWNRKNEWIDARNRVQGKNLGVPDFGMYGGK